MSVKYIEVTVEVPVAANQDSFIYFPGDDKDIEEYEIGQFVEVPFGGRRVTGCITGFAEEADISSNKIRKICRIIGEEPRISPPLLEALKKMSRYYHAPLQSFIKAALPAQIREGGSGPAGKINYCLNISFSEARKVMEEIKSSAPAQARIMEILLENQNKYVPATELVEMAKTNRSPIYSLEEKGLITRKRIQERRIPSYEIDGESNDDKIKLNHEQRQALSRLMNAVEDSREEIFLLHGVTGSGKTEIYFRLVEKCFERNESALILVPEIALTPYLVNFFYHKFPRKIAVMHSRLSSGERRDEWKRIKEGEARLVIGARSAVFAPFVNPGLIVIDEEHENSYKQESQPHYHARGAAVIRSQIEKFPVVLGSATPSVESYYFSREGDYNYMRLRKRAGPGKMPEINIIDMRKEAKKGNYDLISENLKSAIDTRLKRNEQVLIFLNRRGFASFILCQNCGEALKCNNCDITLTFHMNINQLKCHYCGYNMYPPENCPSCGSDLLQEFGAGTERLEEKLCQFFPAASVARMDLDTTTGKHSHRDILMGIDKGDYDIIVGTQMIAKGHDFHNITLVGILGADIILNLPDFRSSERTYQLLTQVAGRAGRGKKQGEVIVQTHSPDHYALKDLKGKKPENFYDKELDLRKKLNYPPHSRLVRILFRSGKEKALSEFSTEVVNFLNNNFPQEFDYRGPQPAPLKKIKGRKRWHLLLFFNNIRQRQRFLPLLNDFLESTKPADVTAAVDVDPLSML